MIPRRISSIRANLAWLVAACLVPAIFVLAGFLTYTYSQQRAQLIADTVVSAHQMSTSVDREFSQVQLILGTLASSPYLKSQDFRSFHAQASEVLRLGFINNITLIDATGQQLLNTAVPFGQPLPKTAVMAHVERVFKTGKPQVSNVAIGAVLQKHVINVAVPVHDGPAVAYTLSGLVLPAQLQKTLIAQGLPKDHIVIIFDGAGAVAARSHEIERFLGKEVAPDLAKRIREVNEDQLEAVTLEGITAISAFSRSPTTGWGAAIGIPVSRLTTDLRKSIWSLAGVASLLLAVGLLVAWRLGGRISNALGQLKQPAENLILGKVVHVPALAVTEADTLGRALVQTSIALESANNATKNSEARMRGILLSAMDAIITVDEAKNIVLFNAAAASMFGCPKEDAIGTPLKRFIPTRLHAQHADSLEQQEHPDQPDGAPAVAAIAVGLRRGGEEFPAEVSFSSVFEGGVWLHTMIIRDVTSRVEAYKSLERSNLDLQQFAYVASHDLKTPLRSIGGFVQLLEKNYGHQLDDKARGLIRRTVDATKRLEQLTEDLLSYARIDSEAKEFVRVNLADVAHEVVQLLDANINSTGATVHIGALPDVMGDRTQLVQLLLNLVGNGLKYCRDRTPVIRLSATQLDNFWQFSVADNGIGIDPQHLEKVFEVFKRLHTQSEFPGTGIGLAVCRRVVEGHGGRIWVTSSPGEGSVFSFTIPSEITEASHEN